MKRVGSLRKVTEPTQVPSISVQNNFSPAGSFDFSPGLQGGREKNEPDAQDKTIKDFYIITDKN